MGNQNHEHTNSKADLFKTLNKLVKFVYLVIAYVIPVLIIVGVFVATVIQGNDNGINPIWGVLITVVLGFGVRMLWMKLD